ncbi:MAG: cytochrome c nitrite reductase small subunit [Anaerolineaceae bacterium]|nr:MAG: cytochrome c nitrite reductase small subunit [Anaerolineaceae bacterium]
MHDKRGIKLTKLLKGLALKGHAPGLVIVALFGVAIGLGLFTFNYGKGTSYFSDNPLTCVNCHVMRDQFEAWTHSSHARVATCNDCHTPNGFVEKWFVKGLNGWNHSVAFTLGGFHEPIRINDFNARVVQNSCVSCHETAVHQMISHFEETMSCVACHSGVGHDTRN